MSCGAIPHLQSYGSNRHNSSRCSGSWEGVALKRSFPRMRGWAVSVEYTGAHEACRGHQQDVRHRFKSLPASKEPRPEPQGLGVSGEHQN